MTKKKEKAKESAGATAPTPATFGGQKWTPEELEAMHKPDAPETTQFIPAWKEGDLVLFEEGGYYWTVEKVNDNHTVYLRRNIDGAFCVGLPQHEAVGMWEYSQHLMDDGKQQNVWFWQRDLDAPCPAELSTIPGEHYPNHDDKVFKATEADYDALQHGFDDQRVSQYTKKIDELAAEVSRLSAANAELVKERDDLKEQTVRQEDDWTDWMIEASEANKAAAKATKELEDMKAKFDLAQHDERAQASSTQHYKDLADELRAELAAQKRNNDTLTADLIRAHASISDYRSHIFFVTREFQRAVEPRKED